MVVKIQLTAKLVKELEPQSIAATAERLRIGEAEAVFRLMRNQPVVGAASYDWADIPIISMAVIRELLPFMSYREVYCKVLKVITLYDTEVISIYRSFTHMHRLALFVNEMTEVMLEVPGFAQYVQSIAKARTGCTERLIVRGLVMCAIARKEVRDALTNRHPGYFRDEIGLALALWPEIEAEDDATLDYIGLEAFLKVPVQQAA